MLLYDDQGQFENTRKLKIEQHESHFKQGVNSGFPERLADPAKLLTPIVLLFMIIILYGYYAGRH
jgi:hypothetical protein